MVISDVTIIADSALGFYCYFRDNLLSNWAMFLHNKQNNTSWCLEIGNLFLVLTRISHNILYFLTSMYYSLCISIHIPVNMIWISFMLTSHKYNHHCFHIVFSTNVDVRGWIYCVHPGRKNSPGILVKTVNETSPHG